MNQNETKAVVVSETRFAHFVRSASPAERQSVFVRAMKIATEEQKRVIAAYNSNSPTVGMKRVTG